MAKSFTEWFSSIGGIVAVAAPKGLCPVCVAASGGALASLGLGFLAVERNIRWFLAVALTIAVVGFVLSAHRHRRWAHRHRRWWTVALGALGATTLLVGRFMLLDVVLYGGMVLLLGATIADWWARRHPWTPLVQLRLNRGA
jgi:hypothetical protein